MREVLPGKKRLSDLGCFRLEDICSIEEKEKGAAFDLNFRRLRQHSGGGGREAAATTRDDDRAT